MKVLLLTTYRVNTIPFNIQQCQDRYQLLAYHIYTTLQQDSNIEVILGETPHRGHASVLNRAMLSYEVPTVDHAIIIDDKAFHKRSTMFLKVLRKTVSGSISSIGLSSVYNGGEDILFYFNTIGALHRPNTICLGWSCDPSVMPVHKYDNEIIIILDGIKRGSETKDDDRLFQLTSQLRAFVERHHETLPTTIRRYLGAGIMESGLQQDLSFQEQERYKIIRLYREFGDAHVFLVTNKNPDYHLLYELAFCNVIIVAPKDYVHHQVVNDLQIVTYDGFDIPWRKVGDRMSTHNNHGVRDLLIAKGCTVDNAVHVIKTTLENYNGTVQAKRHKTKLDSMEEHLQKLEKIKEAKMIAERMEEDKKKPKIMLLQGLLGQGSKKYNR